MGFEVFLDKFESFVGVNFWTMIFAWCNLIILYFVLRKLLFKPVKKMIDSRQEEIDGMYSAAQKDKDDAEVMKKEYTEKLKVANEESEQILKNAQRKAQLREEEILKEANVKAARTLERAREEVELEKKRAVNEVKDSVSDLAISIASKVIERDINREEHEKLIDEFISSMGEENDTEK